MWNERLKEIVKRLPPTHRGGVVWDDYNQRFSQDQDVIGTITTNIGSSTPRNGIKIIEIMKTDTTLCLNSKVDGKQPSLQDRVYDVQGCSTAITTSFLPSVAEPISVAMRGRNPENPSERGRSNGNFKQRIEPNMSGVANTITSVQKDSMVAEPMCSVHPNSHKFEFDPETSIKPIVPALRATDYKAPHCIYEPRYRIRKLTPRECFRLMGVEDKDIDTIQTAGISNSQQYKLAGNSIVVDVLYHIFRKAFCETHNENQQQTLF